MKKKSPKPGQHRPFTVVEYNPNWPTIYEKYKKLIAGIFGESLAEVVHIGSTSVPGMTGKPNIDICATVTHLKDARKHYSEMKKAGFACHGDYSGINEEYFTIENESGERVVSLHVFAVSSDAVNKYKNFRDYLIEFDDERDKYIKLKRSLYSRYKDDYQKYDTGKKQLIDEIRENATEWASKN